jgi:TPP-dependent pyruvate/acetoin dehydrogenase alpha subunit
MPVPSISRLLLNGTGIVTIDSRDAAGAVTGAAFTVTLAGAVNQIEFPYYGDGAVSIRGTFTGSASAKVI